MLNASALLGPNSEAAKTSPVIIPPCLNDLKTLLIVHGAMPIKALAVTEQLDSRVKSILLVGPSASCKRSLLYALCHEMRATVFDLSCDNLVGKYCGPDSVGQYGVEPPSAKKHQEQFMYTLMKVAKANQPAVLLINEADSMFYKKVPKEIADSEPKRLKKDWPKLIKKFPIHERILVLGTASEPFPADQKSLCKLWDKILMVPRPDYGTRYEIFKYAIQVCSRLRTKTGLECDETNNGVAGLVSKNSQVDLATLARLSNGYTSGQLMAIVESTMETLSSVIEHRTLRAADFISNMSKMEPVSQELEEEHAAWYMKTPIGKRFNTMLKADAEPADD